MSTSPTAMNEPTQEELNLRYKFFKEWLENDDGYAQFKLMGYGEDLERVRFDEQGNVVYDSIRGPVNATMMAMLNSQMHQPPYSGKHRTHYRSLYQKGHYIEQTSIDTVEQFEAILTEHLNPTGILFRGQREAKWQLYNALQRKWLDERLFENGITYQELIQRTLKNGREAQGELVARYFHETGILPENDVAVLSFLQHHGCPTPLLDWTYSFLNALYFAFDSVQREPGTREIDNYVSVYYIEEKHFATSSFKGIIEEALEGFHEKVRETIRRRSQEQGTALSEIEKTMTPRVIRQTARMLYGGAAVAMVTSLEHLMKMPVAYFSDHEEGQDLRFALNNNLNIVNQEGVFMWNADPSKATEHMGREIREQGHGSADGWKFCKCYNINKDLITHIRERLDQAGVNDDFLFPKANKLAKEVWEKSKAGLDTDAATTR